MTKEQMMVHEALTELKTLDKRIRKKIEDGNFATYRKINSNTDGAMSASGYKN